MSSVKKLSREKKMSSEKKLSNEKKLSHETNLSSEKKLSYETNLSCEKRFYNEKKISVQISVTQNFVWARSQSSTIYWLSTNLQAFSCPHILSQRRVKVFFENNFFSKKSMFSKILYGLDMTRSRYCSSLLITCVHKL